MRLISETLVKDAESRQGVEATLASSSLVAEPLRRVLVRLVGIEGYVSLVRRSLAIARSGLPILGHAKVRPDGTIDGLDELFVREPATRRGAAIEVTCRMLELLVTFLGQAITHTIVREICPSIAAGMNCERKRGGE